MAKHKIGRNDPCWCGSGKKFKKCHSDRATQPLYPYHELSTNMMQLRSGDKTCMCPSPTGSCEQPVIKAHSISRSAALSKIARSGHIYQPDSNPYQLLKRAGTVDHRMRGINEATTFTGFCCQHDSSLFKSVDVGDLIPTHEQLFFLHYRALCRELYVKRPALSTNELLRNLDRGRPPEMQSFVQELVEARSKAIGTAIKELESNKSICDEAISTHNFACLHGCALLFNEPPTFACSGLTQPVYDFSGRTLQHLIDLEKPASELSFTLLPSGTGGIAAFAWLESADSVCQAFVRSLLMVADDRKSDVMVQLIFDSFENHAIEPNYWDNLIAEAKSEAHERMLNWTDVRPIKSDALIPGPVRFADWAIRDIIWFSQI
jgi:hypothetical protein